MSMAIHVHTAKGGRAIGSHMPLNVALAILPTLPRPLLVRLVANAIDLIDTRDGDPDLEAEVTEQDDEAEEDDHGGGDVGDEGEPEECRFILAYGIDQSRGPLHLYAH